MKPLTNREEQLMRLIWTKDEMTVREILELYPEPRPHFNTVATFIHILENKGWVTHRPIGKTHLYRATVTEEELGRRSLKSIISKFFNGSMAGMVSSLLKDEEITPEEIEELKSVVRKKKMKK